MVQWEFYFPFPTDTIFHIDGPFGYDGTGRVLDRTADLLKIRIDLDRWGPAPAFHAVLTVQYRQEGSVNTVILERDAMPPSQDDNAAIRSDDNRHERAIASKDITCSIRYNGEHDSVFEVHMEGLVWHFALQRA